jgi:uncharacterized protein
MIAAYHHRLRLGDGKLDALRHMLQETTFPLLVTSATTVIGFASLMLTDIRMLIDFGYASAMALTANYVVSAVAVPILLRVWRVPRRLRVAPVAAEADHGGLIRWLERLADFNFRHRRAILAATAVLVAASLVGWYNLRVDTDPISFFRAGSPVRTRIDDLHRSLAGAFAFYVIVDSGRPDGIKDPALLRQIAGLQDFLAGTGKVDKSVSIADYVRKMHREMNGGDPAYEVIPDTADHVAQYVLMLEGKELTKFLDFDAAAANIVVRHDLSGSGALTALLRELDGYIARTFPANVRVGYTGEAILLNNASDYMALNEITSFSFTFVVVGLIHTGLFMSIRAGALSLIPNLVPILFVYGIMGLVGIPLNAANALVASIAVGIAVDDTVHHMVTYSQELKRHRDQRIAMLNTIRSQGRPIVYVSLALIAGFVVFAGSSLLSGVQFGLLSALAMALALVCELVLTPLLMASIRLVTLWDLVLLKMEPAVLRDAPLLRGLSRWEARKVVLLGTLRTLEAGELVIRKGEVGTEMYMVVSGRVRVFDTQPDGRERTLTVLGPGAEFGEIGLLTREVRSASVIAESPSEVLRLDFPGIERIRLRFPYTGGKLFRNLALILSDHLRRATADLTGSLPPVRPSAPQAALPENPDRPPR